MVDLTVPCCLFVDAEVIYEGRAASTLERGNYLVLIKGDGSVLIHANALTTPLNYLGPGTKLQEVDGGIYFSRRNETIKLLIHTIKDGFNVQSWSVARVALTGSEREIVLALLDQWHDIFPIAGDFEPQTIEFDRIETEYPTELGPVDLVGLPLELGATYVVEVKRRRATIKDVGQLRRYLECFSRGVGFLVAPSATVSALKYLKRHGLFWVEAVFEGGHWRFQYRP